MRALAIALLVAGASAAAEGYVHSRLAPDDHSVTLAAGARINLTYEWRVDFENTTCAHGTMAGVDFFVDRVVPWASANFFPGGDQVTYPGGRGSTTLEVIVDEEAPNGGRADLPLATTVQYQAPQCSPPVKKLEDEAVLHVVVVGGAATATSAASERPAHSPSPGLWLALAALWFARRRG